jgi:ankyrin repeat protein
VCGYLDDIFNDLYTACKTGSIQEVRNLLEGEGSTSREHDEWLTNIINRRSGQHLSTLLHVASKAGHAAIVQLLLKRGADPAIRYTSQTNSKATVCRLQTLLSGQSTCQFEFALRYFDALFI